MNNSKLNHDQSVNFPSLGVPPTAFSIIVFSLLCLPIYSLLTTAIECISNECTNLSFMGSSAAHNGFFEALLSNFFGSAAALLILFPIGLMLVAGCCALGFLIHFFSIEIQKEFPHALDNIFKSSLIYGGIAFVATALTIRFVLRLFGVSEDISNETKRMLISLTASISLIGLMLPALYQIRSKLIK